MKYIMKKKFGNRLAPIIGLLLLAAPFGALACSFTDGNVTYIWPCHSFYDNKGTYHEVICGSQNYYDPETGIWSGQCTGVEEGRDQCCDKTVNGQL
jgi:hypothetical protein